jgi:ketosteroid isomerase-like protein
MLRISTIVPVATILGAPLCASAPKRSARDDRHAIVALENQWIDARDAATLDRLLADDFVHPGLQRRHHQQGPKYRLAHETPATRKQPARFAQLQVRLFGDVAQAYGAVSAQETAVTAEPKS